ncbi:DUF1302 family protein [Flavobacteriaceae bacterium M23B6Z8]
MKLLKKDPSIPSRIIKLIVFVQCYMIIGNVILYGQTPTPTDSTSQKPLDSIGPSLLDMLTDDTGMFPNEEEQEVVADSTTGSFWKKYVFEPTRLGISYELTYKFTKPDELIKNRFAFRVEYSKFLFNNFFLQLDTKFFTFLEGDARSRPINFFINDNERRRELAFGSITRNAYLQYSFGLTSIKVGIQTLAWGESDFAAVVDEINPFDFRDPLNLNIDELRLGQFMLSLNLYSSIGNWSGFFVPNARFNLFPEEGTRFFVDPFEGRNVTIEQEKAASNSFEYGIRWKKTFGKSDISIIATSLIDNNITRREVDSDVILESERRFTTLGSSFNYAVGNLLIRGEAAFKFPRTYNDANLQLIERDAFDSTLSFEYAPDSRTTYGLELVHNHILDWTNEITGVPRNDYSLFLSYGKQFLKNDLSVNLISLVNWPYFTSFNLLSAAYKWNDNITLSLDTLVPITNDERSGLFQFREQQQFAFKIQLLF